MSKRQRERRGKDRENKKIEIRKLREERNMKKRYEEGEEKKSKNGKLTLKSELKNDKKCEFMINLCTQH